MSAKSVFEECLAGVSANSVSQEFFPRVSSRSVSKSVVAILSSSDVFHACLVKRVFPRLSFQECSPHVVASGSRKIPPPVLSPPSCCLLFSLLRGIQVRGTLHIIGMVVCWFVARSYHMWFLLEEKMQAEAEQEEAQRLQLAYPLPALREGRGLTAEQREARRRLCRL